MISKPGTPSMRIRLFLAAIFLVFVTALAPASAEGCEAQARALAQSEGARLLAVTVRPNKCIVRLLIKRDNRPPKRKTVVLDRK